MSSATLFVAIRNLLFLRCWILPVLWNFYPALAEAAQKPLTCRIATPSQDLQVRMGEKVAFAGKATLEDAKAKPLKYEWDFGGGAQRLNARKGKTVFERDNARYRVRFTVTDAKGRYCEDAVYVTVGHQPHGLPPKVAEQPRPMYGEALGKKTVVLPFNDMAMQSGYPTYGTIYPWESINNLNAQVIRKGTVGADKPVILDNTDVTLKYSAASNPRDPAGAGSINSTSQNWPIGGDHTGHGEHGGIQKFDNYWGTKEHSGAFDMAIWWLVFQDSTFDGELFVTSIPPDEGLRSRHNTKMRGKFDYSAKAFGKGRQMPGVEAPYEENNPQDFSAYLKGLGQFTAEALPLTNIDDQGRMNNFPLMRVEARDKKSGKVLSRADAVVTHGSDFQCRECHLKGQIGADPTVKRKPSKFNYKNPAFNKPTYVDAESNSIADLEKAAIRNVAGLHTWYDFYPWAKSWGNDPDNPKDTSWKMDTWVQGGHSGFACYAHHNSTVAAEFNIQQPMMESPLDLKPAGSYPLLSKSQHGWHGRLQQDSRGKLVRDKYGNPVLWDVAKGANPNTLFPTGKGTTMEDNCLKCHAGKREQLYRDRMYTAGVQCVDCHGDMLATAQLYKKPKGGYRQEWLEQPDCGSCHSGFGKDPVATVAYDPKDLSATTLPPKSDRFAVQPATVLIRAGGWTQDAKGKWHMNAPFKNYTSTAFRHSRDTHGRVACGACHGAAHAIWPNRDPNANDNVTALQLQGHTGSVSECSVCHTKDAFKKGQVDKNGDGILAGPHGMHPVNDPSWFAEATDSSGKFIPGGWHGKYTWRPGKNGGEQCSACHGADHRGTRLAKVPVDREYRDHTGKLRGRLKAGEQVSCALCHTLEVSFGGRY